MSIWRLKRSMRKYASWVLWGLVFIFAVGSVVGFSFLPTSTPRGMKRPSTTVATVEGAPISREEFDLAVRREFGNRERFGGSRVFDISFSKQSALEALAQQILQKRAAHQAGVSVSRKEVNEHIAQQVDQQIMFAKYQDGEKKFHRWVSENYGSEAAFRQRQLEGVSDQQRQQMQTALLLDKLRQKIEDRVKVTEKDYRESVLQIKARVILVRSNTPSPPPGKFEPDPAAKAKADTEALKKAEQILREIKGGKDFAAAAKERSDDSLTRSKGGDVGWLPRNTAEPLYGEEFTREAFKLKEGEMGGPLRATQGFYLVKVERRKYDLPSDYDGGQWQCSEKKHEYSWKVDASQKPKECPLCKSKKIKEGKREPAPQGAPPTAAQVEYICTEKKHEHTFEDKGNPKACPQCGSKKIKVLYRNKDNYIQQLANQERSKVWQRYLEDLKKQAKIDYLDPELQAYAKRKEADQKTAADAQAAKPLYEEAIRLFREALSYRQADDLIRPGAIHYEIAQCYSRLGDYKKQVSALEEAIKYEPSVTLHQELARLYQNRKEYPKAVRQFERAVEFAPDAEKPSVYAELARLYRENKQLDKAVEQYQRALKVASAAEQPNLHIELARLYRENKQTDKALEQLAIASKSATPQQTYYHNDIAGEYKLLGRRDLAAIEEKKAKAPPPAPPAGGMPFQLGGDAATVTGTVGE